MLDPAKADGIIIGASSMDHLKENVELCKVSGAPPAPAPTLLLTLSFSLHSLCVPVCACVCLCVPVC